MFPSQYFTNPYFGTTYWPDESGIPIDLVAAPGLEYTVQRQKPRYTVTVSRLHFTVTEEDRGAL